MNRLIGGQLLLIILSDVAANADEKIIDVPT